MSIIIQNISDDETPLLGENTYRLMINHKIIATFTHIRADGLAECLRAAAEAAERAEKKGWGGA